MRLIFHSEARAELDEAMSRYEEMQTGLGLTFEDEVEMAAHRIRDNPKLGAPYRIAPFRFTLVRRFPFVIYYAELEEVIWIVAVAHENRRPGYWKKRRLEQ
jgi:toxin ParE1/3/4